MESSRWKDIYLHLESKGFDVYAPSCHVGECQSPYVVIKSGIKIQCPGYSTTQEVMDFMCYVKNRSELDDFLDLVKEAVRELRKQFMIRSLYTESEEFYDDTVKGYMKSFQYAIYKRIED